MSEPNSRHLAIIAAYAAAVAGRDPGQVEIAELLKAVFAVKPDVTVAEVGEALAWAATRYQTESAALGALVAERSK